MIDVLVVEDDPVAAAAHALYVRRTPGFRVAATVHNCADALRQLGRARTAGTPVDLVLLDLYLPDGHGLQLCHTLRAAGHSGDVIAVTSARDLAMVRQAVSAGVVQYLLKPFSGAALYDRLERYARYRDTLARHGEATGQDEVDQAFAALRATPERSALPKGLSAPTLETVAAVLRGTGAGLSAAAVGAEAGVSRITARRYLEHLVEVGFAVREPQYGQVGRPELCYRIVPQRSGP
ncbi:response regulator [Kitasatospora sp. HPMI-4]|uniref:response regulator n=1 Tax=Kitasatospora sp. HPMI-4 TaxID=3448443 RepID=UPI003F19A98B